jgi:hypothetical protein
MGTRDQGREREGVRWGELMQESLFMDRSGPGGEFN